MKRKQFLKTSVCICATVIFALLFTTGVTLFGQEADPFYLNLLEKAEKSLLEGNFSKAIEELEIAAFGLTTERRLEAKAYVYMSLSYFYLKDLERSKNYLKEAQKLVEAKDFQNLNLHESVRTDLESLVNSFKAEIAKEQEVEKMREKYEAEDIPPGETKEEEAPGRLDRDLRIIRKLEKDIEQDPRKTSLYYDLYLLYKHNNNVFYAKRTLENLIKNNPSERQGYYLLGKLEFEEKNYGEAEKIFEKILNLFKRAQLDENILSETRAYIILASYLRGKEKKAQQLASSWIGNFTEEKISSFSINIEDKEKLQRIVNTARGRVEAEKDRIRIKRLEAEIKKEPRDTSLYYELYELYSKRRKFKEAKETLKNLVKNNPNEKSAFFLLAKIEYSRRQYKDALKEFSRVMVNNKEMSTSRELVLKSMIYSSLCYFHLDQKQRAKAYITSIYDSASEDEIMRLVRDEGLEQEWDRISQQ